MTKLDYRFCVAPMMTHTDRHFRYFLRLISHKVLLYTEMVTTGTLIHGDKEKYLKYNKEEHPIAIQLGGSKLEELALCARMAEDIGYDEVNLNVGCPSDRVQSGKFGACLMAEPQLVADCIAAMQTQVQIPVTVKNRIGIDNLDSYDDLKRFIENVAQGGCKTFIVHARKAWLKGLSLRQNRSIPPLDYQTVHQLKKSFPALNIIINGGFTNIDQVREQLCFVDGVMIGRAVCNNPYMLVAADKEIFNAAAVHLSRTEILERFMDYIEKELKNGTPLSYMTRNIFGLYYGQPGARTFRRYLSDNIYKSNKGIEIIKRAMEHVQAT